MNIPETGKLLATIALGDGRAVDKPTIALWQDLLDDLPADEVMAAARIHLREDPSFCTAAKLRIIVKLRRSRQRPSLAEQDELEARRIARIDAIASTPRAIEVAPEDRSGVPDGSRPVSGPARGIPQSPDDHAERPNLPDALSGIGRAM